jgi:hypothetical protein
VDDKKLLKRLVKQTWIRAIGKGITKLHPKGAGGDGKETFVSCGVVSLHELLVPLIKLSIFDGVLSANFCYRCFGP